MVITVIDLNIALDNICNTSSVGGYALADTEVILFDGENEFSLDKIFVHDEVLNNDTIPTVCIHIKKRERKTGDDIKTGDDVEA